MIFSLKKKSNAMIYKLAKRNLKVDKGRNILLIVIIALASCLIVSVSVFFFFTQIKSLKAAVGIYQAAFSELDSDTASAIQKDERLKVGLSYLLGVLNYDGRSVIVRTMDENLLQLGKYPNINGRLPNKYNEIAVTQSFLDQANLLLEIGDNITLDLGNGDQQFVICGILPVQDSNYSIYVSNELIEKNISNPLYSAYINVVYTERWSKAAIQNEISNIAKEYKLDQEQITFSTNFFSLIQQRSSQYMMVILVVSSIVAAVCALVIYSLFYVSVTQKTNEYGKLRTIGASKKQISRMVLREGNYIAYIGIPIGIILGEVIGYILVPAGGEVKTAIVVAIIAAIYMYICVMLAVIKPAKTASKVTPIEALRYITNDSKDDKYSKKLHRTLSSGRLALLNCGRNKKKFLLTVCSLGVSGILLMGSSAYFNSIDPREMARQNFPYGEISVELGAFGPQAYQSSQYIELQENNLLSSEIVDNIKNLVGVNSLKEYKGTVLNVNIPTGYIEPLVITAMTEDDQKLLEKYLITGTTDIQELSENDGIIITNTPQWKDIFGWEVAVGDTVSINLSNESVYTAKIMGIIDSNMPYNGYSSLFTAPDILSDIVSIDNLNYQVVIDVDDNMTEIVMEEVEKIFSNTGNVYITDLNTWIEEYEKALENYRIPVFIFIMFIGVFGFINLLNTLITNVFVRKHEFAILQAVGLGNRQLSYILLIEGLLYTVGAIILAIIIGSLVGYAICKVFNSMSVFGDIKYQFPIWEMLTYSVTMLVIQVIFSFSTIKQLKKQTIVERLQSR